MSLTVRKVFGVGAWRQAVDVPRRRFGVPVGGPWDREAAQLAQALLKIEPNRSVFEILHGTVELSADGNGTISVVGTGGQLKIGETSHPLGARIPVEQGQVICVQAHCAYLAWCPQTLSAAKLDWRPKPVSTLRYLASDVGGEELEVKVSPVSSRAGLRLVGLAPAGQPERASEPCCIGAIQQTPSGELIVIGPDGPTIGGYPCLGVVIEADLNLIPRLTISQELRLVPVPFAMAALAGTELSQHASKLSRGLTAIVS